MNHIIEYNNHISSTLIDLDSITLIIYPVGATIKLKKYNQNHLFISFSLIEISLWISKDGSIYNC